MDTLVSHSRTPCRGAGAQTTAFTSRSALPSIKRRGGSWPARPHQVMGLVVGAPPAGNHASTNDGAQVGGTQRGREAV